MNATDPPRCFTRTCGACFACASANNGPIDDVGRKRLERAWLQSVPMPPEDEPKL